MDNVSAVPTVFEEYIDIMDSGAIDHIIHGRRLMTKAIVHCNKQITCQPLLLSDVRNVIIEYFFKAYMVENGVDLPQIVLRLLHLKNLRLAGHYQQRSILDDINYSKDKVT